MEFPHITSPDSGLSSAARLVGVVREHIIDGHNRIGPADSFNIHEVAQCVFKQMHAIDKNQVWFRVQDWIAGVFKKIVTGLFNDPGCGRQFEIYIRCRINADGLAIGQ